MLDPARPQPLDLTSFDGYLASCRNLAQERLSAYRSVDEVARAEAEINQYPRLAALEEPREILVIDEQSVNAEDIARAAQALLSGAVLLEHACAGEATRLGLGTKYLLSPPRDLVGQVWDRLLGLDLGFATRPADLRDLSLGRRHMLQQAWDLWRLAEQMDQDPREVLARQRLLVIVNEASAEPVLADFRQAQFYGFEPRHVLFMVQRAFPGLDLKDGAWTYDPASPPRLHNHGQMLLQTTMDGQLFSQDGRGRRQALPWSAFQELLAEMEDKVSFNIEDLDYLGQSLDLPSLAAALKLGDRGARMVMEVVTNNPQAPIKGGACCWDAELGKNVMIESFQLTGLAPQEIRYLNRNINHYPRPLTALQTARGQGLSMPIVVKDSRLYYQPVQGDLNFLLPTAFVRRAQLQPIHAWKAAQDTPAALNAMAAQDQRPGFLAWAAALTGLSF